MIDFYLFVKNNMAYITGLSAGLQIIGTLVLALFSFKGLQISQSPNVSRNGKPITHVTIINGWLLAAQTALIILLAGIFIAGVSGVIASIPA